MGDPLLREFFANVIAAAMVCLAVGVCFAALVAPVLIVASWVF